MNFTATEKEYLKRAVNSMMHWHEEQAERNKTSHPTIAKRNNLEADQYRNLLEKIK